MICINITAGSDNCKNLILNDKIQASRLYLSTEDITSFPNRLVFDVNLEAFNLLSDELSSEPWMVSELAQLRSGSGYGYLIVPFALRVHSEVYTSFHSRQRRAASGINLDLGEPYVFIGGNSVSSICVKCARQEELKGRLCPDFVPGSLQCFKSPRFALESMDTFYLSEKGELVYNATHIVEPSGKQLEDNTVTVSDPA